MLNLDTHIFLHALLGTITKTERTLLENSRWGISSIVIWEIAKLYQLGRITLDPSDSGFKTVLSGVHIWPITLDVCLATYRLDIKSDPADEIICATSITHNIPLITRDRRLLKSKVVPLAHAI
ncbi:MAG TPA: type II toxin-antitoxin system VapC family toxin [Spirochaetota bacterium]|nr:type II toxin-antitoxin system VapC family toxin [Spirochaetota bacterium]HPI90974.1 type II toxin-antitoxin system VapC family toxin [Spirochaetota bacterium]HPR47511.1 type II toxin-antitoxin system VapC family toxin [Spirochaetota bacterium]